MSFKHEISLILSRKTIAAVISSSLFGVLLGLIFTIIHMLNNELDTVGEYLFWFLQATPVYLAFSFPMIFIYGAITSTISDYIARFLSNYTNKKFEIYISFAFHLLFGLILLWTSLLASVLFFITDYILRRKNIGGWKSSFKSLVILIIGFILYAFGLYIVDSIIHLKDRFLEYLVF
ncbi:hypothetical protein [Ureibacillus sp. FSL E2-3493]|uniref:hypothetical protein n=1 Tax=Ureibacillus sp. FSL E2-3493 TaxID=2921367 RepID=UPI0031196729